MVTISTTKLAKKNRKLRTSDSQGEQEVVFIHFQTIIRTVSEYVILFDPMLQTVLPELASPWYQVAPFMVMLRKGNIMAFQRAEGEFWLISGCSGKLGVSSPVHLLRASGDDHASTLNLKTKDPWKSHYDCEYI